MNFIQIFILIHAISVALAYRWWWGLCSASLSHPEQPLSVQIYEFDIYVIEIGFKLVSDCWRLPQSIVYSVHLHPIGGSAGGRMNMIFNGIVWESHKS